MCVIFFLMIRRPPRSTRTDTLFPYTTLFRSVTRRREIMRRLLQYRYLIAMLLTVAALSGCNKADDYVPGQGLGQAGLIGIGVEVAKIKVERRLEVTCNPLNLLSDGTYCVSNYKPTDRQEVWCFKSLGTVACYNEPDPYSLAGHQLPAAPRPLADPRMPMTPPGRSEEHTSELQSLMRISYAVFCLKKKTNITSTS